MAQTRIAVVSVYFTLFDAQMPDDFRARQEARAVRLEAALASSHEVVAFTGLLASDAEAERANRMLRDAAPDVVVFAPAMVAPPSYAITALADVDAPTVLWNAPAVDRLGEDLDQASAHEHTSMLGVLMLANVLQRRDQPVHVLTARPEDPAAMDRLHRTIRALAAARRLRGRTALRIGDPFPGYLNIEADAAQLSRLGIREQSVTREELEATYDSIAEDQLAKLRAELAGHGWRGDADERGVRLAASLRVLAHRHDAVCGTVNCHGPLIRGNENIGVPACLGTSVCTAAGVPFSCTGDQPAAIALTLARALAGSVLYCEFYAPELATDMLLVATGGEGDTGLAANGVEIVPSSHYPGVRGAGAALAFELPPGPVTMISLTPLGKRWRVVWALGELVEARYPRMRAPNAMFRFSSPSRAGTLDRWIASGATHHNAMTPGHLAIELPIVAAALGIESHQI